MAETIIRDVKVFVTAPRGINLVVVKVETGDEGLSGYGCATFTWRYGAVVTAVRDYLAPLLKGKNADNIEDLWQLMKGNSYWRNGPVLNNAISGVDEALWDIKAKRAGLPLYSLLGGKSREGIAVYRHADGSCLEEVEERVSALMEEGYRHIRCHLGTYGGNWGGGIQQLNSPRGAPPGAYFSPRTYMRTVVSLFERMRSRFGFEVELMHDVHERLAPVDALALARSLEPFGLFFLEDALPPSQWEYYRHLREQTCVPLAMGELFTNQTEWMGLVQNRWIDFIRVHISCIGGLTPALKLAHFCEAYGVRTAWHGPADLSPVGMAVQMHLDAHIHNFGIQEFSLFSAEEEEIFPGCPRVSGGYAYLSEEAGTGVGFNEEAAKRFPAVDMDQSWLMSRLEDGTAVRP